MRIAASTLIVSLAAALLPLGLLAGSLQAGEPHPAPVADNAAGNVAAQPQGSCDCEEQPCGLATVFSRFTNPGECDPHWSFTADALALQRTNTRSQALFLDANLTDEVLNANHLDPSAGIGFQLSAIRHGPNGWDMEWRYFQIDGWIANSNVSGDAFMVVDAGTPLFITDADVRYTSALHSAEINLRREWFEGFTLLAGFRMGELDELYSANSAAAATSVEAKTFNHLYGFQLGAEWEFYNMGGPLRISALCKSGIFGNAASQSVHEEDPLSAGNTLSANRNQAMFMGEAGAVATYDVTCHLSFRASLDAVWLQGVALAPEQLNMTDFVGQSASIDTHGGLFYYGGGLGMELKF